MSTYIAPVAQTSQYVSGIPLDLIVQVGQMKQARYNQVRDDIQSQLNMIGSSDIIKDSDREYINNKLQQTVDSLNQYSDLDLSDSNVSRDLTSSISQLYTDQGLQNRIINNRRAAGELRRIQKLKQDGDETYNSANEKVFMNQLNNWQNNPDQIQFNATYTPYTDVNSLSMDLIKPILSNPDIRREIENYVGADGKLYRKSDTEIKEATQQRLMQALQGLPQSAINQLMIDYEASKDSLSVQGALQGLQNRQINISSELAEWQSRLAQPNITPSTRQAVQSQVDRLTNELNTIQQTSNAVVANNDPSLFYTPQAYVQDRLYNMAQPYAYKQVGETKLDPLFSKWYDHQNDLEKEAIKHQYDLDLEKFKNESKLAAGTSGAGLYNDYADQIFKVMYDGKGTLTTEQTLPLLNGVGKINDDGSAQLNLAGRKLYIDIVPTLEGLGIKLQNEVQANAYQDAQEAYKKWINTDAGTTSVAQSKTRTNPLSSDFFEQGRAGISLPGASGFVGSNRVPRSFEEFLNTNQGKKIVENAQLTGIDLTNPIDIANVKKYINSPEVQALDELFGKGLDGLVGTGNFTPFRQDNVISDKNGDLYTKGTLRMTRGDWITKFNGITNGDGEDLWDKLIDDGYMKYTQGEAGKDDSVAELTVNTKLDRDFNSAMEENLRKRFSGDKATTEQIPLYMQDFRTKFGNIRDIRQKVGDLSKVSDRAITNITLMTKDLPIASQQFWSNNFSQLQSIANDPNRTAIDRFTALDALDKLGSADVNTLKQLEVQQNVPTNQAKGNLIDRAAQAAGYLQAKGLPKHVVSGILGNLMYESNLDPTIPGDNGKAKGIAQWHPDRFAGLAAYAARVGSSPYDLNTQLDYVLEEASQRGDLVKILQAKDAEEATMLFGRLFEKPSEAAANWKQRVAYANQLFGL